jgi:cytochrome P450
MNEAYWPGLVEYFEQKVRDRLENPGDDIISELIRLQIEEDGAANVPYLTVIATELMVGGAGTTGLMIVNAMWLLLEHPDQLELVRSDFSLIPAMLEESLRVESVIQDRERIAAVDTELGGVAIPAGARLRLVLGSGNRDDRVFADADRFDVTRRHTELKKHFGFGYGIHFCLGAPLARMEGQVAFEQVFRRLANLRFAPGKNDFAHVASTHFRGFPQLHVAFDRA